MPSQNHQKADFISRSSNQSLFTRLTDAILQPTQFILVIENWNYCEE